MKFVQLVRALVPLVMLGLAGFVLGCSGQQDSTPVAKETSKKIAEDMKAQRQEMLKERAKAGGGRMQ